MCQSGMHDVKTLSLQNDGHVVLDYVLVNIVNMAVQTDEGTRDKQAWWVGEADDEPDGRFSSRLGGRVVTVNPEGTLPHTRWL